MPPQQPAQASHLHPGAIITSTPTVINLPTIRVKDILDQKCGDEVTYIPHTEQVELMARYRKEMGR